MSSVNSGRQDEQHGDGDDDDSGSVDICLENGMVPGSSYPAKYILSWVLCTVRLGLMNSW